MGEEVTEVCNRCHKFYEELWFAPHKLFERIVGNSDGVGMFCVACFTTMAQEKGIELWWECEQDCYPSQRAKGA